VNANLRVAIAGAGMGGLVAGLALLQNGFRVDIFEQAAELRGLGAGVQLSANGTCKRNVLIGLLTRKTNKQIARDMEISPRTVEVHRMDVMRRLSAQTLPQAVLKASAAGLHPFPPRNGSVPS
jgi:2-polyprenyl-6-methoxyphenol hydroxylase-like FAD-dependent oxidoreductase